MNRQRIIQSIIRQIQKVNDVDNMIFIAEQEKQLNFIAEFLNFECDEYITIKHLHQNIGSMQVSEQEMLMNILDHVFEVVSEQLVPQQPKKSQAVPIRPQAKLPTPLKQKRETLQQPQQLQQPVIIQNTSQSSQQPQEQAVDNSFMIQLLQSYPFELSKSDIATQYISQLKKNQQVPQAKILKLIENHNDQIQSQLLNIIQLKQNQTICSHLQEVENLVHILNNKLQEAVSANYQMSGVLKEYKEQFETILKVVGK
ncbi:Hypothetical_protein [Hexamita inflata]|uniref:Hypothetical_protein n=1 Tax=Hexamita inflata TaxID=28002 RepID=A0AA86QDF3_9EUKA|nr:Hypothetical protein HINF_LOCUS41832 [Hexamita inflata]CAI9963225.1 Hypothetical protein HINF_LOCUS50870 [Hexamita inflata]